MRRTKQWIAGSLISALVLISLLVGLNPNRNSIAESRKEIQLDLTQWREGPVESEQPTWEAAWLLVYNAAGNICHNEETITRSDANELKSAISAATDQPPSWEGLIRIWNRLSESGPYAEEYMQRRKNLIEKLRE